MILVGNKSDIWQERQVVTDKACQVMIMIMIILIILMIILIMIMIMTIMMTKYSWKEAKDEGYSNFFEITTRESLDQVLSVHLIEHHCCHRSLLTFDDHPHNPGEGGLH